MSPSPTKTLLLLFLTTPFTIANSILLGRARDGPCTGDAGTPGICVPTADCTSHGGKHIDNACPNDPEDIKCCTKPTCGTASKGNCRFTSSCASGITETNKCPGPESFKCCMPGGDVGGSVGGSTGGSGDGKQPGLPSSSSGCKQTAISGANKIIEQFPGKVREIGCIRQCSNPSSSDHCTGMATDMMIGPPGGKNEGGEPIAEWVMQNRKSLSLRYVMWGQRIWEVATDAEKPWSQWRYQACTKIKPCTNGNRGSNTDNHWDHVHVSYN